MSKADVIIEIYPSGSGELRIPGDGFFCMFDRISEDLTKVINGLPSPKAGKFGKRVYKFFGDNVPSIQFDKVCVNRDILEFSK